MWDTVHEQSSNAIIQQNGRLSPTSINNTLKLYEALIFCGPIIFTLIILFLFYYFYLRRHRVDWSSLRMRQSNPTSPSLGMTQVGLTKEYRGLLPIIIYMESFSIKDSQCSVCLGDYQAEDRLQQIPGCGHTFHLSCIDSWLATHTTCPLCRHSLVSSKPLPGQHPNDNLPINSGLGNLESVDVVPLPARVQVS